VGDQRAKVEGHVDAGFGPAERGAVEVHLEDAVELPVAQASPSVSGVTSTGESAEAGFGLDEAEALGELGGDEVAQDTSLTRPISLMCSSASRGDAARHVVGDDHRLRPRGRSPSFVGERDRVARASSSSEPPWYMSGSVQKLSGISAPRAFAGTSSTMVHIGRPSAHW
jgi:hypothetical protein